MQAIRNELQHEMQVTQILGTCLPIADFHAVSVSLPKWSDVVGYEEGKSEILHSLTSGYPRFRFHDAVYTLMEILRGIFPTLESIANAQDEAHSFLIGDYSHNPYNAQIEVDRRAGYLQWYIFPTKPIAARFSDFLHYDLNKKRISVDTNPAEKIQLYDMQASIKLFHIVNTPYVAVSFHDVLAVSVSEFNPSLPSYSRSPCSEVSLEDTKIHNLFTLPLQDTSLQQL